MQPRVPVTILSGFLGSGKTTLLNRLLGAEHGLKVAVIVNEFGQVGIDGNLVAGGEQFVELDNGCLCCVLNEDLERILGELRNRGGFEHVLLETTGLADPLPVGWVFSKPGFAEYYRLDSILVVVDSLNIARALDEAAEATLQIERADMLVLNKTDLVADRGQVAEDTVRELNPSAVLLRAANGDVPWALVLGHDAATRTSPLPSADMPHHPSYASFSFQTDKTISDAGLEELLGMLPDPIYRVKGVVHTDAEWGWSVAHAVAGRFEISPFDGSAPPSQSSLAFIGKDLDEEELTALCHAIVL